MHTHKHTYIHTYRRITLTATETQAIIDNNHACQTSTISTLTTAHVCTHVCMCVHVY